MKHEEGFFNGANNANTYQQSWLPDGDAKAVLLIFHGLAEHSGRYMNVVNHFVPKGYAVYGLDHYGHGKSEGDRVFVPRFEQFTDTIKSYFDKVRAQQPGKPIFLVGHSMGGLISSAYLLDHQQELAGAVLSGASVQVPDNISPTTIFMGKLLSNLLPKLGLLGLDANDISRDPAVVDAYVNDPLVYTGKTTTRLAAELLKGMQRVSAEAGNITLPILVVHGSADKLVPSSAGQLLYDRVSSPDKTLKIYDGLYHEVFNEPERDVVLGDVEAWLEERIN